MAPRHNTASCGQERVLPEDINSDNRSKQNEKKKHSYTKTRFTATKKKFHETCSNLNSTKL